MGPFGRLVYSQGSLPMLNALLEEGKGVEPSCSHMTSFQDWRPDQPGSVPSVAESPGLEPAG